jgi:hypothetical protein
LAKGCLDYSKILLITIVKGFMLNLNDD